MVERHLSSVPDLDPVDRLDFTPPCDLCVAWRVPQPNPGRIIAVNQHSPSPVVVLICQPCWDRIGKEPAECRFTGQVETRDQHLHIRGVLQ